LSYIMKGRVIGDSVELSEYIKAIRLDIARCIHQIVVHGITDQFGQ
jgi:hypothetical protein